MTPKPLGPVPGLGYAQLTSAHAMLRVDDASAAEASAAIAEEVPVAMVYNGEPFVVVMASPADFEDLAVGFSLTEGIVEAAGDLSRVEIVRHSRGVEVQMTIPAGAAARIAERRRGISARTGCGVCGIESIDEVLRVPHRVEGGGPFELEALWRAAAELETRQPVNAETRAVHAAALAGPDGGLVIVREDVGRHNALDKVIGAGRDLPLRFAQGDKGGFAQGDKGGSAQGDMGGFAQGDKGGFAQGDKFVIVTSRASYELVQKTAAAGIPLLAAVSRPTSLAIQLAEQANITLVGLLRGRSANVYSHPARLAIPSSHR